MSKIKTAIKTETGSMMLLPPAPGKCQECATEHAAEQPHNAQSMFYQMKFKMEQGRFPTWVDAMKHCTDEVRSQWRGILMSYGVDVDAGQVNPPKGKMNNG